MTSELTMVYPPISNTDAYALKTDPDVRKALQTSDFYIIGMSEEAKFKFKKAKIRAEGQDFKIPGSIITGNGLSGDFILDVDQLAQDAGINKLDTFIFKSGDKGIAIYKNKKFEKQHSPFAWFTPEKLIYERSRAASGIGGFANYEAFCKYRLLYIGIAKTKTTLERLIDGAHEARQRILSLEKASTGANVSDEMVLFPLSVNPKVVLNDVTDLTSGLGSIGQELVEQAKDIVIDAEKALVSLFHPHYNRIRFVGFPSKSVTTEGLRQHGYTTYGFELRENLTFEGERNTLRGSRVPNCADRIVVDGKDARFEPR